MSSPQAISIDFDLTALLLDLPALLVVTQVLLQIAALPFVAAYSAWRLRRR
jgi:hypothetical protein